MLSAERIAIVGTGLVGASIGLGLRQAGFSGQIIGIGRRLQTVEHARDRGCIDTATTDLSAVTDTDLAILATPLGQFPQLLRQLSRLEPTFIITDVGSTKQQVCADASDLLPQPSLFVGAHPMAGGEQHGPEHAHAHLFTGKPCVITPHPESSPDAIALVESLWSVLGMRLIRTTPKEHDRQVAQVSHLPHALAVLMITMASDEGSLDLASTGFRDTTRIASGDAKVWHDIFTTNHQSMITVIDQFTSQLQNLRTVLATGEDSALRDLLEKGKRKRDDWIRAF